MKCKLVLENGREFHGLNFGSNEKKIGEIFFSTSMVGYQDILSDPSYHGKIACMSYPLIGNYGVMPEDYESDPNAPRSDGTAPHQMRIHPYMR